MENRPEYQRLIATGEFAARLERFQVILSHCTLCPRSCGVDRLRGERGVCGAGVAVKVAGFGPHFGEEPPLSGERGAGTIFFTHCTLRCCYCQNYQISQEGEGNAVTVSELAEIMLALQNQGCHNLDLVTPTHYLPSILEAIGMAAGQGLQLPLVYNCGGYESLETLRLLEGIVDIYLPDWKYGEEEIGRSYSQAPGYPKICQAAIREMYRQVGDLVQDEKGVARKGMIVRHLVLPSQVPNSVKALSLLRETIPPSVRVSLMSQFYPCHQAAKYPELNRVLTVEEYEQVKAAMEALEFDEYWVQELESRDVYRPDFKKEDPFSRSPDKI